MEVNKEEAMRCLHIAQRHRNTSNLPSALRFARKSVSLYSTPEGEAMIVVIEREIESGGSSSTSGPSTPNGTTEAKASGVEEHVSSAHARPGHGKAAEANGNAASASKKREYTVKQMEVVTRVKRCKHHEYYEILAVERTCNENDVKKAYKKLALALHPDKNGAPGADEAFKMVSKAFQVLSDADMRQSFDANPSVDPTQRGGGGGGGGMNGWGGGGGFPAGFGGGGGGFQGEINPEDLFNMFFGGGGGFGGGQANVFTFGGPGGFQAHYGGRPRRRAAAPADQEQSAMVALIPILLLVFFAIVSIIPGLLGENDANPAYSFEPTSEYPMGRSTFLRGVPYWVNQKEWEGSKIWESVPETRRQDKNAALYSSKVKVFEKGVESVYINRLHNECDYFNQRRQQEISQEAGIFGIGANYERIAELRKQKSPSCQQLSDWGLLHQQNRPRGLF